MRALIKFNTEHKINLIKAVRETTGLGLKEAKDSVECGIAIPYGDLSQFILGLQGVIWRENSRRANEAQSNHFPEPKKITYTLTIEPYERPNAPFEFQGFPERGF